MCVLVMFSNVEIYSEYYNVKKVRRMADFLKKKWLPPGNQSLLLTLNLNTMKN